MTFMLEVEFSGLCGYLVHPDGRQVGIIMPDARQPVGVQPTPCPDGDFLPPHVGYLRYDLADTGIDVPIVGRGGTPGFEVVHRFDLDELEFDIGADEPMEQVDLYMPDVDKFAPGVRPTKGMFGKTPQRLLMRTILRGGRLTSVPNSGMWKFSSLLNPDCPVYTGQFAGFATWRRRVHADEAVLRLNSWKGETKMEIRLKPRRTNRVVKLKIANLCSNNPLEWPELFLRVFNGDVDKDFKWFYDVWKHPHGPFEQFLKKPDDKLPAPEVIKAHGDVTDCTGHMKTFAFLPDEE